MVTQNMNKSSQKFILWVFNPELDLMWSLLARKDTQQKLDASKYPLFILLLDKIVTKGFHATTQKVKPCQAMKYQFHP